MTKALIELARNMERGYLAEIEALNVRLEHDCGCPSRADNGGDGRTLGATLTPEFRKLAQNLIIQARQCLTRGDYERADEVLQDFSAIFVGRGPGLIEVYKEL